MRSFFDTSSALYRITFRNAATRRFAAYLHSAVIQAQLKCIRLAELRGGYLVEPVESSSLVQLVTIVVKSFERSAPLVRLLRSIRRYYPTIKIIVVDDSAEGIATTVASFEHIEVVQLPFNSGVCIGRNAGLARVTTPFFVSLDDDFVFWGRSNLSLLLSFLSSHGEVDLVGGWLVNLPFFSKSGPGGAVRVSKEVAAQMADGRCYKVPQFYMARTEVIREVGWDDRIKVLDHSSFFGRLVGRARVAFLPDVSVLHARTQFDPHYMHFRNNYEADVAILSELELVFNPAIPLAQKC